MAFLEDPRLRQRWNQITHDAEAVTENAAAGIWSFQHNYLNPCISQITASLEQCTTVCLGDPEERLRRRREREREAEYSFDFYDDWYEEEYGDPLGGKGDSSGGIFGSFRGEDWDRLLAGTGSQRKHGGGETSEQPKRKRGMSYGTKGGRRKANDQDDPTIIPSTQPIGFLSKLPWKMGGTLRYKPSAADLQDHPNKPRQGETEPLLLASDHVSDQAKDRSPRKRSGTTGSGDTSDSFRSRGDLFPSDGEGDEDAVPLDDEVTYDMVRRDDRSSGRTRSSKGKRPAFGSRSASGTTLESMASRYSQPRRLSSLPASPGIETMPSLEDLQKEEERLQEEENEELSRKKEAAEQLAVEKGLKPPVMELLAHSEPIQPITGEEISEDKHAEDAHIETATPEDKGQEGGKDAAAKDDSFVGARLPHFA